MPEIPPWLTRDYDPVGSYIRSYQVGAQIGEAQTRIAEQQRQANMEHAAKQEAMQANILKAQQEMLMEKAYKDQQLSLENARLEESKARNMQLALQSARDFAARQKQSEIKNLIDQGRLQETKDWHQAQLEKGSGATAAMRNVEALAEIEAQAKQAETEGKTDEANALKQKAKLLRNQMKGPPTFKAQFGPGNTLEGVSYGPDEGEAPGQPTTIGTLSFSQQRLQQYEIGMELMNKLKQELTSGSVGISGNIGEWVWDRGAVQLANMLGDTKIRADQERVHNRVGIAALRENLMKVLSSDQRFSQPDVARISKILPSTGVFESVSRAKQAMEEVSNIIRNYGKTLSRTTGMQVPLWALDQDEILKLRKENKISYEAAKDALERFH